ncbi:MAG: molybdopterin oxidoreductase family protein [Proteobacteria bacterium]|nr:molybdopterin oxidoreductase family protein [Pseudomonadota bacterium]
MGKQPEIDTSLEIFDEVKTTTCYMCACRCGIRVHLKDGKLKYIEGNPGHPVNKGVLCAKGAAGLMNHFSPARLRKPLLRVGERGAGEFKEISWDEALELAAGWLSEVRRSDPSKLAFFTGRDQSQSLTSWWASQFGTPNYAAHGGFCSVNMAVGGLYSIGGSFWEFGEPDWARTRYLLMFGVAEDHNSNPIKGHLGRLKGRKGTKFVSVNPVRTGYSAIADEWIGIRPGSDGLFILAIIHELLRADKIDFEFLGEFTNCAWLVIQNPGKADDGLFLRDRKGNPQIYDGKQKKITAPGPDRRPELLGKRKVRGKTVVPVFELLAGRYLDEKYSPETVAAETGVPADQIKRIAAEIAHVAFDEPIELDTGWTDVWGKKHRKTRGRAVSIHAMRGISAHSNGFQTCRALHLLQMLIGTIDVPGGWLYKPPFPKQVPPGPKPAGHEVKPGKPLGGPPLGFVHEPADLLVDENGKPKRIDKAYSWENPLSAHGMMHMVLHNAWKGDPYPVEVLFMYMANMGWNSSMNIGGADKYLTDKKADGSYKIPRIIYSDAFYSETVAYADLVLPDTTYLERWDCISLLDRPISGHDGPADAIRQPVVAPDRDVRPFQDVILDLGARLGLPGMIDDGGRPKFPGGYKDYIVGHERTPGIGPLAGWRGDGDSFGTGAPNPGQLEKYIENGCYWKHTFSADQQFYRHSNAKYLEYAKSMGWVENTDPITLQVYSEPLQKFRLAAEGHGPHQPPDRLRARIKAAFDPLPIWYPPLEGEAISVKDYPLHAITQRPMHMYHSWGSGNAWLRQITNHNRLYINPATATKLGIGDDDWVWVISCHGRVKGQVRLMSGTNPETVWTWNAIGRRKGAMGLSEDAPEATKSFLLNHIISELLPGKKSRLSNSDPVTGQAAWYDLRVRVEKCKAGEEGVTEPLFSALAKWSKPLKLLRFGKELKR